MLHLKGISKQYGSKVLLEGASAHLNHRSRAALIGPNGAGKSTLIRIILGQESADSGEVSRANHLSIGHLAQEMPKLSDRTVLGEVMSLGGRRHELLEAKAELEAVFSERDPSPEELERYGRLLEEVELMDEYRLESRAKAVLGGLGFAIPDFGRKLGEFSGGWLMRVALARVLLMEPDLLLLDEPTNHLDLESLLWLEDFLRAYRGALLLVSHDTAFLNRMVSEVIEIDQRKLVSYRGNLDAYRTQKTEKLELMRSQSAGQDARIAELEDFIRRFGAKATKARQAQSRAKALDKIQDELVELPEDRSTVRFRFPPAPHSGREVVTLKKMTLKYGAKPIFNGLDWVLPRGSRVAIVGVNGAGKTTLLKLIAGEMAPTAGIALHGHQVRVGYYAQHQAESLNMGRTIVQELEAAAPEMPIAQVRGIAGAFLFSGDAVEKKCGVLSGGEKARVALAKLLLSPANFLVLDEPTNHLDVESRGVLLEALQDFEGTLCLVSHDRDFVTPLVDTVLEILPAAGGSSVQALLGSYEDYLERKMRENADQRAKLSKLETPSAAKAPALPASAAPPAPPKPGVSNNQRRAWEKERDQAEAEVGRLEARLAELTAKLSEPGAYDDKAASLKLVHEQAETARDLETRMARWEELCALLG